MSEPHTRSNLLSTLKALYRELVQRITLARQKSYQPKKSGASGKDLSRQLHDYIRQAPAQGNAGSAAAPGPETGSTAQRSAGASTATPKPSHTTARHGVPDSVGARLVDSAWEHLHASVRFARMGDTATARLHAGIMESSLKEAAHYLDDDAYAGFVKSLGKELGKLTGSGEPGKQQAR